MAASPTRGASEPVERLWHARTGLATLVRIVAFCVPLLASLLALRQFGWLLFRPPGRLGLALWIVQAAPIGALVSAAVERGTRRLLPLATLLNLAMVFPDQAPSRFALALRAGTVTKLSKRVEEISTTGLGQSHQAAATKAIELVAILSQHDRLTRGHSERVRAIADLIATELGMSEPDRLRLAWGVLLHDIGKLLVPPEILNKAGALSDDEWLTLQGHPAAGLKFLQPLSGWLGSWLLSAADHHERWDGTGYPQGLRGTDISLAGRITAVADAYDVITSKRSYKQAMSVHAARKELVDCAGTQFDPAIVRSFLKVSIGRRRSLGPFTWLSDVPLSQIGSVAAQGPAVTATGIAIAISSMTALPPQAPQTLPFIREAVEDAAPGTASSQEPNPWVEIRSREAAPSTTQSMATTSRPSPTTVDLVPAKTTTIPGTKEPITTKQPTEASTTQPVTTQPVTPQPTTSAPTTTTIADAPAPQNYLLRNPETGDSTQQYFKGLSIGTPANAALPNFDTNLDTIAGLSLTTTPGGFSDQYSLQEQHRFGLDLGYTLLRGSASITLFAAVDQGAASSQLQVELSDCDMFYMNCTAIAGANGNVTTPVDQGFQELSLSFGEVDHDFSFGRRLVLRIVATGPSTVHVGFDAVPTPSSISVVSSTSHRGS